MENNILIITDYAAPYKGNFMMSIKSLEQQIEKDGGKIIYLFTTKASNIRWLRDFKNIHFLKESILENTKIINKIIKSEKINVMYTHFCLPKTQLAVKISKTLDRKILMLSHFHNHYFESKNPIKKFIFRYAFCGDINIGCSKDVAESLPFNKKKNKYVTNAIDFSRLDSYEEIKIAEKDKFVILMFGYTYERKGIDLAIKAIKKINKENIILAISVSKNMELFKQQIIDDFGEIPNFVKLLEPRNDIATYYKASNLFLSAAREEGFCYAIVESMYCGIPCICTELPGQPNEIPELIKVRPENVDEISEAILSVYDNSNTYDKNKVVDYLIDNYSISKWSEEIKKIIDNERRQYNYNS